MPKPGRVSAYEQTLRNYAEKKSGVVINPAVGTRLSTPVLKHTSSTTCTRGRWGLAFRGVGTERMLLKVLQGKRLSVAVW